MRIVKCNILALCALVLFALVFYTKFYTHIMAEPVLYAYTLFVAVFELSRISGSFLYDSGKRKNGNCPTVSFIIPVKDEEKVIADTIGKCFESDYPKHKLEVVVVDDGSTDGTWDIIENMKRKYSSLVAKRFEKNLGKRHAMAEAIRMASGEVLIQLDSDSFLSPGSLERFVQYFSDEAIGAVCAHTDPVNSDENIMTRMQHAYYFMSFRILKAAESLFDMVFCCSGCCSAYKKALILPFLDEWLSEDFLGVKVSWGDDRALTNLILKSGYRTVYASDVQAFTIVPSGFWQFVRQQVRWKKGWFVNSINASRFIFKRDPFVALTYFFPLILITVLTPIIALKALVINPLLFGISPFPYIIGILIISGLLTVNYLLYREDRYWKYMFVWSFLNMTFLSYIFPYALFDLKNMKWGTR